MKKKDMIWIEKNQLSFQHRLLRWYKENKRVLPWRETRSPYLIWLSEIMLQQTRVDTVIPYFHRFIFLFPTIQALANANLQDVLKAWEGLGYYSRIRNMHRAAKFIMERYNGAFPNTYDNMIRLPGIGRYTAGAICSIAFDIPVPVVDGNVMRVLSRIFLLKEDIRLASTKKQMWQFVEQLISKEQPGDFNQAIMELGATVCMSRQPQCETCPLASICTANQKKVQHTLPIKKSKPSIPHYDIGAGLVWRDKQVLISRRQEEGLLGGLWEFPGGKQEKGESIQECVRREINEELEIEVRVQDHFLTVKHAYSHFRITLHMYHCLWISGEPVCHTCTDFRWVKQEELEYFPFPKANKRVVEELKKLRYA